MQPINIINGSWKQGVEPKVVNLTGTAFMEEAGAHVFHISAEDASGAAIAFTGTVSALFLRADNTTVAIDGEISEGAAEVTLVSDCYHVPGRFSIAVYVSDGTDSACVYAAVGNVYRTSSDVVIDSGATIPTLAQLQAAYQACIEATEDAEAAALTAVTYAAQTGQTDAQKEQARDNIGAASDADVADLKGAIGTVKDLSNDVFITEWEYGTFVDSTGAEKAASTRIRSVNSFDVKNGETAQFAPPSGFNIDFYMWQNNVYVGHNGWTSEEVTVNPSSDTTYRFIIARGSNVIEPSDGANATIQKQYELLKQIESINSNQSIATPNAVYRPQVNILDGQHLMAHRGGYWDLPLNSMRAFKEGYRRGFSIIECDIQVTSDNVVVICHNRSINSVARNADGTTISETINVDEHTYIELLDYDFGIAYGSQFAGTKICTLTEFLLFCKRNNIMAYVDTDSTYNVIANVPTIYNTVKDVNMLKNTMFDCQTYAVIDAFIELDTNLNLVGQRADSDTAIQRYAERVNSCHMLIASCGENYYSSSTWTKAYVDSIHRKGLWAKVTLPNATKEEASEIFNTGTDFVMVNSLIPYTFYDY